MSDSSTPPDVDTLIGKDIAFYEEQSTVIEGVVAPGGQAGDVLDDKDYGLHRFSLAAWRREGGPIVQREVVIFRAVDPDARYFDDFANYSIHRLSVRLLKDGTQGYLDKTLPPGTPDAELAAIAAELQQPVAIPTKMFGELRLNRDIGWFEGKAKWDGKAVEVRFHKGGQGTIDNAIRTAEALWSDQVGWKRKIEEFAIQELLALKNDDWRDEGEKPLTAKAFLKKMSLRTLSFHDDGNFELWHDDGDLFWGHAIQISGSLAGLTDADIPG